MENKKSKLDVNVEKEGDVVLSNSISLSLHDGYSKGCRKGRKDGETSCGGRSLCLNVRTIQEMLQRFLVEKKMSEKKLAQIMGIEPEEVPLLFLEEIPAKLVTKINLPLIKQYCKTRWNK